MPGVPVPGDIVHVGRAASVQFDGDRCLVFSVTAVYMHLPGLRVLHPGRPAPPPPRPPNGIPRQFTPPRTNSRLTGR